MADGKVTYEVRADDSKIKGDLESANKTVVKESESLKKTAGKVAKGVGVAFAGIGTAALKFGSEFEQSFADASTLFGDVAVETDLLKGKILDLSDESGIAADDLNKGLYQALSAGVPITEDGAEAIEFLEKATKLAKAGFTDIETAIDATSKTLNAYGLEVTKAERIQKILIQTQNNGITTVGELGNVLANVTPTAAAAGVSFEEVGASLATMTAQGTATGAATTQLNAAISAFLKPNSEMNKGLAKVIPQLIEQGKITGDNADKFLDYQDQINQTALAISNLDENGEDYKEDLAALEEQQDANVEALEALTSEMGLQVVESEGLQGALTLLDEAFEGSTNQMAGALGSTEALKASLALTGENAATFEKNLEAMGTDANVVDQAFNKVSDTTQQRFTKNLNELKNVAIGLFGELQNVVNVVFEVVEAVKTGGTQIELMGVAIGTVTTLLIAYNIQQALTAKGLTLYTALTTGATTVTTAFSTALAFLTSPIGIVIAAIGGLVAAIILIKNNWETVSTFLKTSWQTVSDVVSSIIDGMVGVFTTGFEAIGGVISSVMDSSSDVIESAINGIIGFFDGLIEFLVNVFTGNWEAAWNTVSSVFASVFNGFVDVAKSPLNTIIDMVNGVIGSINSVKVPDWVPGVGGASAGIPTVPKLAKGGLAFGETLSVIGDNPNANIDPEVVAPLSKLKSMFFGAMPSTTMQQQQVFVNANLKGNVEVDGVTLGEIVLENMDEARDYT